MAKWKKTIYFDECYQCTDVCATTNVTAGEIWNNRKLAIHRDGGIGFAPCDSPLARVIREHDMDIDEAAFWIHKTGSAEFTKDFRETYNVSDEEFWDMWLD